MARCPAHDDRNPSLSIAQGATRPLLKCHAGCTFQEIRDALRSRGIWPMGKGTAPQQAPTRRAAPPPDADAIRRTASAKRAWDLAFPCLKSTPAEAYLRHRGIWEPAERANLRYDRLVHPETKERNVPALIVPRTDPATGEVAGVQRIFLTEDGRKYDRGTAKMSLGSVPGGRAELFKPGPELVLAEGVETALSAALLLGLCCWAFCGGFPPTMQFPAVVKVVAIVADHDRHGVSERKARALALALMREGIKARVLLAANEGDDANDVLRSAESIPTWPRSCSELTIEETFDLLLGEARHAG
jgi:putative DNA primase/helicase